MQNISDMLFEEEEEGEHNPVLRSNRFNLSIGLQDEREGKEANLSDFLQTSKVHFNNIYVAKFM